jgi:molybdopterin/thiamine biosynthesis adenylyltransferase
MGIGGLGTHLVQQLALLGVGEMTLIDHEELDETNRNRYIGCRADDPIPGTLKTWTGERLIKSIDPDIHVRPVNEDFVTEKGFSAVIGSDYVFGCLDTEGARMILTELCAAYDKRYSDLPSEILPGEKTRYGGRVCVAYRGRGCLLCLGELDRQEASLDIAGDKVRRQRDAIYGIDRQELGAGGPSVVTINGVVASLAATEFMLDMSAVRPAIQLLKYYGHLGKVTVSVDQAKPDCYICKVQYGRKNDADVQHYIRDGFGKCRKWLGRSHLFR